MANKYINWALNNNPNFNISNYCKFLINEINSGKGKQKIMLIAFNINYPGL